MPTIEIEAIRSARASAEVRSAPRFDASPSDVTSLQRDAIDILARLDSAHGQSYQRQMQTVTALAGELRTYAAAYDESYTAPPKYSAAVYALFTHEHSNIIENGPLLEACIGGPPIMCAQEQLTTWVDKALLTLALSPKFYSQDGRRRAKLARRFADWITEHPLPEVLTEDQALRLYSVALPAFIKRENIYMRHMQMFTVLLPRMIDQKALHTQGPHFVYMALCYGLDLCRMPIPQRFEDLDLPAHTTERQQINREIAGRITALAPILENIRTHIVGDITKMLPQLHRPEHPFSDEQRTELLSKFDALQKLYPLEKPLKRFTGRTSRRKATVIRTFEHLELSRQIQTNRRLLFSDENQSTHMDIQA